MNARPGEIADRLIAENFLGYMKAEGFRKRGRTWTRNTGELTHVINLQLNKWNESGKPVSFFVNYGIFSASSYRAFFKTDKALEVPKEYDCTVRKRLNFSKTHEDWVIEERFGDTSGYLPEKVSRVVMPFFDGFATQYDLDSYVSGYGKSAPFDSKQITKRIVTKIGDVFETEAGLKIQLVAIDPHQLMSDVLAAYDHEGYFVANGTSNGRIIYCAHTTASAGVREGVWRKVGKAPLPDLSNVAFKTHIDAELVSDSNYNILRSKLRLKPEGFWYYWKIGDRKVRRVSEKKAGIIQAEEGSVYPAIEYLEELTRRTERDVDLSETL